MELPDWMPWYQRIAQRLSLRREEDQKAADMLSNLLEDHAVALNQVRSRISGRVAIVFGAGPSLASDLSRLTDASLLEECCLVAADGATTALMSIGKRVPDVIATDLDGRVEDQIEASRRGSVAVIHAHGDNIPVLRRCVAQFVEKIGSTQVEPRPNVYNFGGFTDGDRGAFLAVELDARALVLAGMDFGQVIGEYSKPDRRASGMKIIKLRIGLQLLGWLSTRTIMPLYNVTERGVPIKGFERASTEEVKALL